MNEHLDLVQLDQVLATARRAAIGGHINPDGDCAGSMTALCRYIGKEYPDVAVDLYLKKIPDAYAFIADGLTLIDEIDEENIPVYDVFFCLDCASIERLGFSKPVFRKAKLTVNIDHHVSNPAFADINRIDPDASSTSELIYDELDREMIDRTIAEDLFIGISHDTGIFRYSCTSPKTMRTAADLIEHGINSSKLITKTYCEKTFEQQIVMAEALLKAARFKEGRVIASWMSIAERELTGAKPEHMDGIVEQLRDTTGVLCAIFLYETVGSGWKLSLRSEAVIDVSKVAAWFNGGGHKRAAGAMIDTNDPIDAIRQIVDKIGEQIDP